MTQKKMKELWTAVWEAAKEPLRLVVIAVIPVLLVYLGTISAEWAGALIVVLRLIDSILHEVGKVEKNGLETGLTRF
jgi:hypothetical protein